MRDESRLDDLSSYVAARWETVVRTTVLLGVPPSAAAPLAAGAVARARRRLAEPEAGGDPDVVLFTALVEAHGSVRPWWNSPPTAADAEAWAVLGPVEEDLDRLPPGARARVVLEAVALLPREVVDEIVLAEEGRPPADLLHRTAVAAASIPVDPQAGVRGESGASGRLLGRRAVSLVAAAMGLALAVLTGLSAVGRLGTDVRVDGDRPPGTAEPGSGVTTGPVGVPVPWYAGGVLHLSARDVPMSGVVALDSITGGVVATTQQGALFLVDGTGGVSLLAGVSPGAGIATSGGGGVVAYIGDARPRRVTVVDSTRDVVVARLPVGDRAEVAAVDGLTTYVNDRGGYVAVTFGVAQGPITGVRVLDAAAGVLATVSTPGEVTLTDAGRSSTSITVPGDAAQLSPGGRFAVVSGATSNGRSLQVLDVDRSRTVALALADLGEVTDAAFADDETLVVVARGSHAAPSSDRDDPDRTPRGSDLVVCDLELEVCDSALSLGAASAGPVLAH